MSTRIMDGTGLGQRLYIRCDKCGKEVAILLGLDKRPLADPPPELMGWIRGVGQRDVCPECQSKTDLPTIPLSSAPLGDRGRR